MRSRIPSPPKHPGIILAVALLLPSLSAISQSNNSKSQSLSLPDPTPRETDLHLLLHDDPQAGTATHEALERRNAKRRELVEWAANELVTLSERLQSDVARPKTNSSMTTAAANVDKIEQLAKNLTAALKAP